jgi:hypothetical protein
MQTLFIRACYVNNIHAAAKYIKRGVPNINAGLIHAFNNKNIEMIQLLIENGANNFQYVFVRACWAGDIDTIEFLYDVIDPRPGLYIAHVTNNNDLLYALTFKKFDIDKARHKVIQCLETGNVLRLRKIPLLYLDLNINIEDFEDSAAKDYINFLYS